MLYSVATAFFALALLVGVASVFAFLLSFLVRRIPRKIAAYSVLGSLSAAVLAIIIGAVSDPPAAVAPTRSNTVRHVATAHKVVRKHAVVKHTDTYAGEPSMTIATHYHLSRNETNAVAATQRTCVRAQRDDDNARAAKDSMGVAIALEVVAQEWDACDVAIQQTIEGVAPLRALSDYDYVGIFGVIPSHPLLEESGAYGSAGTEWEQFGQPQRAIEDLHNAVDVGRKMVSRGYSDEGRLVISDNEAELRDAESQTVQ